MIVEDRLRTLGLHLPDQPKVPADVVIPFAWARVHGDRVFISGHGPQDREGRVVGPFGHVGQEVSPEQAREAARLATLSMIASLKRAVDDLDRVAAWLRVEGYVLVSPGFDRTTAVVNAGSELLVEIFGPDVARHARTAMGVAATPLSCPVVLAAEVALRP